MTNLSQKKSICQTGYVSAHVRRLTDKIQNGFQITGCKDGTWVPHMYSEVLLLFLLVWHVWYDFVIKTKLSVLRFNWNDVKCDEKVFLYVRWMYGRRQTPLSLGGGPGIRNHFFYHCEISDSFPREESMDLDDTHQAYLGEWYPGACCWTEVDRRASADVCLVSHWYDICVRCNKEIRGTCTYTLVDCFYNGIFARIQSIRTWKNKVCL